VTDVILIRFMILNNCTYSSFFPIREEFIHSSRFYTSSRESMGS